MENFIFRAATHENTEKRNRWKKKVDKTKYFVKNSSSYVIKLYLKWNWLLNILRLNKYFLKILLVMKTFLFCNFSFEKYYLSLLPSILKQLPSLSILTLEPIEKDTAKHLLTTQNLCNNIPYTILSLQQKGSQPRKWYLF